MAGRPAHKHPTTLLRELAEDLRQSESEPGLSPADRVRFTRWREHAAALEAFIREQSGEKSGTLDMSELPPELLRELSAGHADELESQIIAVLKSTGGSADLDRLLIGLYRQSGAVQKRRFLQNKLWRMVRKGLLRKNRQSRGMFFLANAAKRREKDRVEAAIKRRPVARKASRRK